jgi:hypothetical protein
LKKTLVEWDVWWAFVPFEDKPEGKVRPVVITKNGAAVLSVTSNIFREDVYVLQEPEFIGLFEESAVIWAEPVCLPESAFKHRIGTLHIADKRKLMRLLQNHQ